MNGPLDRASSATYEGGQGAQGEAQTDEKDPQVIVSYKIRLKISCNPLQRRALAFFYERVRRRWNADGMKLTLAFARHDDAAKEQLVLFLDDRRNFVSCKKKLGAFSHRRVDLLWE